MSGYSKAAMPGMGAGQGMGPGMMAQGQYTEQYKKFAAETLPIRQEMMTKHFELQKEFLKEKPDQNVIKKLQGEVAELRKKMIDAHTKAGLPMGKMGKRGHKGMRGGGMGMMMMAGMAVTMVVAVMMMGVIVAQQPGRSQVDRQPQRSHGDGLAIFDRGGRQQARHAFPGHDQRHANQDQRAGKTGQIAHLAGAKAVARLACGTLGIAISQHGDQHCPGMGGHMAAIGQ